MNFTIGQVKQVHDKKAMHALWDSYQATFADVNKLAANRHLMYWEEFSDVMWDKDIIKFIASEVENDVIIGGIGVLTNSLKSWPLISPDYFAHQFPDHYEENRIWYCGFSGVDPRVPRRDSTHIFMEMTRMMADVIRSNDGIVIADFCTHNVVKKRLAYLTGVLLNAGVPEQVHAKHLDSQQFWAYRFDGKQFDA